MMDLHQDPNIGAHSFVFVNNKSKQVIMAFRGGCFDNSKKTCRGDSCFTLAHQTLGSVTNKIYGSPFFYQCSAIDREKLHYEEQASERVKRVKEALPGYSILLVGHSLGGYLAAYTAAQFPGDVQAVAFAPLTVGRELENHGFAGEDLDKHATGDIITLCDPYDCTINSLAEHDARRGTVSCFYDEWNSTQVPSSCFGMKDYASDLEMDGAEWVALSKCVLESHLYTRYRNLTLLPSKGDASKPLLPTCSSSLSVLSDKVVHSMRYAQKTKLGPWARSMEEI
uniref:AB hydrolase-1 domain-containing protein n=1 Tax=Alexandrium andersonii TaxID=327968 RepID=A0A7S2G2V0_9DINO